MENYQASRIANEKDIRAKAEEHGIYDKAKENLQKILQNQLDSILDMLDTEETYTVQVVIEKEDVHFD